MGTESDTERRLRQLTGKCRHYRLARSAGQFCTRLVRLASPGVVAALALLFVGKIAWPPLIHAVWLVPLWVVAVSAYLVGRPGLWRVETWQAWAVTDLQTGNRGTFMAVEEADGGDWAPMLGGEATSIRARFPLGPCAAAGLLGGALAGVLLLGDLRPPARPNPAPPTPVEQMAELVEVLQAENLADTEYLEDVREMLAELKEEEAGGLDSERWQALDRARQDIRRQVADSLRELQDARLQAAELADRLRQTGGFDAADSRAFSEMVNRLDPQELKAISENLGPALQLSPEQLEALISTCKAGQCSLSEAELKAVQAVLQELEAKLGKACDQCTGACKVCGLSDEELAALRLGTRPGRGGVTRGPGPAPLEHVGNTDEGFGRFDAKTFAGREGEPTAELGYALAPPQDGVPALSLVEAGPAREFSVGDETLSWHSRLLPRHNDVLKRYFADEGGPADAE